MSNRREFLKLSALFGIGTAAGSVFGSTANNAVSILNAAGLDVLSLPALPYAYDALEPFIDKETMTIHHTKHHQAYIDKLKTVPTEQYNAAQPLADSCKKIDSSSTPLLRNNLGGHYNHSLFWTLMHPNAEKKENKPTGKLADAITKKWGSYENFNKEFSEKALKIFGSGWCWLIVTKDNDLQITATANQDNPLMQTASDKGRPVLALDVWEHAYYLKYQNKRADYIGQWWNVVNWNMAEELFTHS
jgi:Fe-Mn family superoxide dismutase